MQIEAGRFYRTRGGQKVGPITWFDAKAHDDGGFWKEPNGISWFKDGRFTHVNGDASLDLIAEWTDEPTGPVRIVTVPASTRKEIVPGTHDRVRVGWGDKTTNVSISVDPRTKGFYFDADELRAAAKVLNELADAIIDAMLAERNKP